MGKHHRPSDDDMTDIIAIEVPLDEIRPPWDAGPWSEQTPMFRGMDVVDDELEPVADTPRVDPPPPPAPSRLLLAVTTTALICSLLALSVALWLLLLHPQSCGG